MPVMDFDSSVAFSTFQHDRQKPISEKAGRLLKAKSGSVLDTCLQQAPSHEVAASDLTGPLA
jgi:hypothetical protein